jgi:3-deoxy-manno-octulosonate cytidylyltransferase (CMP-KDO synthetase)
MKASEDFGAKAVMTSKGCASGTDRVAETAKKVKGDIFVNIQGDGPLITTKELADCVKTAQKSKHHEIVTTAAKINTRNEWEDPSVVKLVCDDHGYALYFTRAPIPVMRDSLKWPKGIALAHLSIYAFTRENLFDYAKLNESTLEKCERLEMLRALQAGWRIRIVMAPGIHPEVDEKKDISIVEKLLKKSSY